MKYEHFIEEALGERLGVSDENSKTELFERLKDGVALCK